MVAGTIADPAPIRDLPQRKLNGRPRDCRRRATIRYAAGSPQSSERMSPETAEPATPGQSGPPRTRAQLSLPRRAYRLRVLGMGLASLPLMAVMGELGAPWEAWAWMGVTCVAWPHVAYLLAMRARDPFLTELRNFVIDSAIAGSWVPLLHFNLLPSTLLLTVVTADKINTGVRRLWAYSLPATALALLAGALLTNFAFQPRTSQFVILACLPIMIIHTLAVSTSSYRLVRRVQMQNQRLEELSRIDTLTGLFARGHWETLAEATLRATRGGDEGALLVLDVDRFKSINDAHGHAVGDDVLADVADLVLRNVPAGSHVGRLGGDEFAVVVPTSLGEAELAAERIRAAVRELKFANAPQLRCTVSIGIAPAPAAGTDLRAWVEVADRALYRAKKAGRDRTMSA